MSKNQRNMIELFNRLQTLGFTYDEGQALRRIEMTLQRWGELECGDSNGYASFGIERDETTGKPYMVTRPHTSNESRRHAVADREKGALKRLAGIMAGHPELVAYHQGDCRGCNLYILKRSDLNGSKIDEVYSRGLAVCS
jgi:hypothetical protein